MKVSEILFSEETKIVIERKGVELKHELYGYLRAGDRERTAEALERLLRLFREILMETENDRTEQCREWIRYTWVQMGVVAESCGVAELVSSEFSIAYYYALDRAENMEDMFELCRRLVGEYLDCILARKKETGYSKLTHKCQDYICKNIYTELSVKAVADAVHFSKSYVSHRFKEDTGITVNQYIQMEKIREAARCLNVEDSVKEIAGRLGFASQSHFTAAFKRQTGLTPKQFKKELHNRPAFGIELRN